MRWFKYGLLITAVAVLLATAVRAGNSVDFAQSGGHRRHTYIFKPIAAKQQAVEAVEQGVAGRALVTADGVYAFLETPQNSKQLAQTEPGSVVHIKGKLFKEGRLLHIDLLEKTDKISLDLDLARWRNDAGQAVVLEGVNKCQCGLDVADLPHSCSLGHLHHLEASDGKTYHYLQFAGGKDTFLGRGSHFKQVEVAGRVLPGHFLLVEELRTESN